MKIDRRKEIPERLRDADDAITHLARVLRNHSDKAPNSLREQLVKTLRHWVRMRLRGESVIHPGNDKMAQWAGVKARQARRNFVLLKNYNIIYPVANEDGGRNLATEFIVSFRAIRRWLCAARFNPSRQLLSKLEALEVFDVQPLNPSTSSTSENPVIKTTKKAVLNPVPMTARSSSIIGKSDSSSSNVLNFDAQDGEMSTQPKERAHGLG